MSQEIFARMLRFSVGCMENPCLRSPSPLHVILDHWWLSWILVTYRNSSKAQVFFILNVSEIGMHLKIDHVHLVDPVSLFPIKLVLNQCRSSNWSHFPTEKTFPFAS